MGNVSNLNDILAWGLSPVWVGGQFDGTLKSGTYEQKKWFLGRKKTITTYGLSSISTGNGGSFNKSNWDGWDPSQQGAQANLAYQYGGYGLRMNTGSAVISQRVEDIEFGTPILTSSNDVATSPQGAQLTSTIDNTQGSAAITQTVSFTAQQNIQSNASTTQGYSETKAINIGVEISAKFGAIGAKVNTSLTNSTTINSSSVNGTSESTTVGNTVSNQYTVQPGYKILVEMSYSNQRIDTPYTAPVVINGSVSLDDDYGNRVTTGAGQAMHWARHYGVGVPVATTNENIGKAIASGLVTNTNALNFITTMYTLVRPTPPNTTRTAMLKANERNPLTDEELAHVIVRGETIVAGAVYTEEHGSVADSVLRGSHYNDIINMRARNQVAYTHGGSDRVSGSVFADRIILMGSDSDIDVAIGGIGNDQIIALSGSHNIDAGGGRDKVKIVLSGAPVNDITLGEGADKLVIDFSQASSDATDFVIRDFKENDSVIYKNLSGSDKLTALIVGSSIEIFLNGIHSGTFLDAASNYSKLLDTQTITERGLLNFRDAIAGKEYSSVVQWRDELIGYAITGGRTVETYDAITNNRKFFNSTIRSIQEYAFGRSTREVSKWARENASGYNSMLELVGGLVEHADKINFSDRLSPLFSSIDFPGTSWSYDFL